MLERAEDSTLSSSTGYLAGGERQKSHLARVLHSGSDLALLLRGQTRDATGTDLVAVGDEQTQGLNILVVDRLDALRLQRVLLRAAGLLNARLTRIVALHNVSPPYHEDLRTPGSSPR